MSKLGFRLVVALGLSALLAASSLPADPPPNLSLRKQEVMAYITSGDYAKEVAAVALSANKYLARRIPQGVAPGKKMAIVFDIDETTLTNLTHIVANDFGYAPKVWESWVAEGRAPAIIPVQTIYDAAIRGKIDVFFISARKESEQAATERNLRQVGYDTWTRAYFKPADLVSTTKGFKIDVRRKLMQEGYVIIANIGDQDSDLAGGYAERTFKLPNPFYLSN